jgi:hypothetical protein
MQVQVTFQNPEQLSTYWFDQLVVTDSFGSTYSDVPPQFQRFQYITNYFAYALCGLLIFSMLSFTLFYNISWMRL